VQGSGVTPWVNGVYQDNLTCWAGGDPGYCGPNGIVRPGGAINFSYGSSYLYQQQNVASLLPTDIGNIKVTGYQFGFTAKNGNGWDDGRVDQLTALVRFWDSTGGRGASNLLYGTSWNLSSKFNWTNFNYNETLPTALPVSSIGQVQYGFIGKDNNGWAGPYGPEIINVSFRLKYSTDPCATNPAYSSTCAGFNTVLTSTNLVPNASGSAAYGGSINNSFGIQTALQHSGTGMTVHGFNYGYNVYAAQSYCAFEFITCWDWRSGGSAQVNVGITNASGQPLYSISRNYNESGGSAQNFQYRFPTSLNQLSLGSFNFTATTSGDAVVSGMYSRMVYSQDPCFFNSNYSSQCTNKPQTTTSAPPPPLAMASGTGTMDVGGVQLSMDGSISSPGAPPPLPPGSTPPPPPGSEPIASSNGAPPPPGAAPNPAQGPSPTASASAGPVQRQESGGKSGGGNLSLAMSVVSRVQAADKATQNAAVANAQQVVATSSAAAQEQANQVVEQANALSAESSQSSQTITASVTSPSSQQVSSTTGGGLQGPITMSAQALTSSAMQSASAGASQYVAPTVVQTTDSQVQSQSSQGSLPLQMPQPAPAIAIVQQTSSTYQAPATSQSSEAPIAQSQASQGLPLQAPQVIEQTQASGQAPLTYQPPVVASTENSSMYSLTAGAMIRPSQGINLNSQANTVSIAMITPQMMQQKQEFKFDTKTEQDQPQVFQQSQTAMTRGSILNDIIEQRVNVASFQMEQQMDTVKKNVLPNELAGGVDIAAMAMVPKGYEVYSIVTLRDVPFYKPEAIYKDNKTVDNARVLRGLTGGSDAKHQEMVNQQYKLGN
jgi:hypothetical protein